jgi:predicted transcriptional regulator of viral defense system
MTGQTGCLLDSGRNQAAIYGLPQQAAGNHCSYLSPEVCIRRNNGTYYGMHSDTHTQRVLDLVGQKGLLRASDLEAIEAPRVVLTRLSTAGLLERVGRGLYRLPDAQVSEFESLGTVATKVPQAVFCLLSALQFHELTTQLPREVWIAMPRGSHPPRIDYPPVKMVQFTGEAYSAGVEEVERDGVRLRVYGVAKTVADCFKHRNKIGLDVGLEALKDARSRNMASVDEIWRYAKVCRVANVMRPYLESIG